MDGVGKFECVCCAHLEIFCYYTLIQTTFNITDELSGAANSFNVSYTDATTGYMCHNGSYTVHSTCVNDLTEPDMKCVHIFDVPNSSCKNSNSVNVMVSATNPLGTGPSSNPISIYGKLII